MFLREFSRYATMKESFFSRTMVENRLMRAVSMLREIREALDSIVEDTRALAEFVHNVTE